MATISKRPRVELALTTNTVDLSNLSDDHDFIAPNEICTGGLGLLHCLTTKRVINMSFSCLYHRGREIGWKQLFARERHSLKANINSVLKAFALNRLINECSKDLNGFTQQMQDLYDALKMRMSNAVPSPWVQQDLYREVKAWRELQRKRRLFHFNHDETGQLHSLLTLQRAASNLFGFLLRTSQTDPSFCQSQSRDGFLNLFRHSLILVAQPSNPESMPAIKYEKCGRHHSAKVNTRIICLLDPDVVKNHLELSNIDVTIYLKDRHLDPDGEKQPALQWHMQDVLSADGVMRSFLFAVLDSIILSKVVQKNKTVTPLYNNHLCQMEFGTKIKLLGTDVEEILTITSQPFGICSNAQYFPELVAKVLISEIEEIERMSNKTTPTISSETLTNYVCRYYTRISGVEPKQHTHDFISKILSQTFDGANKATANVSSLDIYEEILTKLVSQIDFFIDHPFMSMMYDDGLFLGIYNSGIDNQLRDGKEKFLHLLLRFNSLKDHKSIKSASVRCIIYNGQLIKSSFDSKLFAYDMCRFIYESTDERAARSQILLSERIFRDFSLYFDEDLWRLSALKRPEEESYKPLIPVLWTTMGRNITVESARSESCSSSGSELTTINSCSTIQLQSITTNSTISSATGATVDTSNNFNNEQDATDCVTYQLELHVPRYLNIAPDVIIDHLREQISNLCNIQPASNGLSQDPTNTNSNSDDFESLFFED